VSDEAALTDSYFLSYSRADESFALRFATDLRSNGVALWVDQFDIRPSEHWDRAIERAVRDCCGLIVILSPRSVTSDNVADEISYAIDSGKPVLPVMIERCTPPLRITRMQMIDATRDYDKALRQCLDAVGKGGCSATVAAPAPAREAIDPEVIRKAKDQLTGILGPIAGILVDKAAAQANSVGEFCRELAEHVERESDRERLMALAGKTASLSGASAPRQTAASAPDKSSVPKAEVERLAGLLCQHLGPIATVVARRESASATSASDLQRRLSSLIPNESERAEFVRRAEAG
jgi:TIR domain